MPYVSRYLILYSCFLAERRFGIFEDSVWCRSLINQPLPLNRDYDNLLMIRVWLKWHRTRNHWCQSAGCKCCVAVIGPARQSFNAEACWQHVRQFFSAQACGERCSDVFYLFFGYVRDTFRNFADLLLQIPIWRGHRSLQESCRLVTLHRRGASRGSHSRL